MRRVVQLNQANFYSVIQRNTIYIAKIRNSLRLGAHPVFPSPFTTLPFLSPNITLRLLQAPETYEITLKGVKKEHRDSIVIHRED